MEVGRNEGVAVQEESRAWCSATADAKKPARLILPTSREQMNEEAEEAPFSDACANEYMWRALLQMQGRHIGLRQSVSLRHHIGCCLRHISSGILASILRHLHPLATRQPKVHFSGSLPGGGDDKDSWRGRHLLISHWDFLPLFFFFFSSASQLCSQVPPSYLAEYHLARPSHHLHESRVEYTAPARPLYRRVYELYHVGLLAWCPIPSVEIGPRMRARVMAIGAVPTDLFFVSRPSRMDKLWEPLAPWTGLEILSLPLATYTRDSGPRAKRGRASAAR